MHFWLVECEFEWLSKYSLSSDHCLSMNLIWSAIKSPLTNIVLCSLCKPLEPGIPCLVTEEAGCKLAIMIYRQIFSLSQTCYLLWGVPFLITHYKHSRFMVAHLPGTNDQGTQNALRYEAKIYMSHTVLFRKKECL